MKQPELYSESNEATYCPEDNKLRLYVGRVPREQYQALRSEGWTSTPKQDCDFAATWTPDREDTAISYAGLIGDEDQSPTDRAADRAERFGGYLDKRLSEARGHADAYDSQPQAHGYQDARKAARAAARHDRQADRAVNCWRKAEYWQARTEGVIGHALYVSKPGVRMGRIKKIEAEQRKAAKDAAEYANRFKLWCKVRDCDSEEQARKLAVMVAGSHYGASHYHHPRTPSDNPYIREHGTSLYSLLTLEVDPITGKEAAALWLEGKREPGDPESRGSRWLDHYALRLAYENQMLQAQGGRAAFVDMEVGGWIGNHQIHAVHKSPATGRVVSVSIMAPDRWHRGEGPAPLKLQKLEVERMPEGAYRAPTEDDRKAMKKAKETARKAKPKGPSLINPTTEDAERLQGLLNDCTQALYGERHGFQRVEVAAMTQAEYSARSSGTYSPAKTMFIGAGGKRVRSSAEAVCKARFMHPGNAFSGCAYRVVVITDKPQKALPVSLWPAEVAQAEEPKATAQASLF